VKNGGENNQKSSAAVAWRSEIAAAWQIGSGESVTAAYRGESIKA